MRNKFTSNSFFIAAFLFTITSLIYFSNGKIPIGICFMGLAVSFISLGFSYKRKR